MERFVKGEIVYIKGEPGIKANEVAVWEDGGWSMVSIIENQRIRFIDRNNLCKNRRGKVGPVYPEVPIHYAKNQL